MRLPHHVCGIRSRWRCSACARLRFRSSWAHRLARCHPAGVLPRGRSWARPERSRLAFHQPTRRAPAPRQHGLKGCHRQSCNSAALLVSWHAKVDADGTFQQSAPLYVKRLTALRSRGAAGATERLSRPLMHPVLALGDCLRSRRDVLYNGTRLCRSLRPRTRKAGRLRAPSACKPSSARTCASSRSTTSSSIASSHASAAPWPTRVRIATASPLKRASLRRCPSPSAARCAARAYRSSSVRAPAVPAARASPLAQRTLWPSHGQVATHIQWGRCDALVFCRRCHGAAAVRRGSSHQVATAAQEPCGHGVPHGAAAPRRRDG